MKLLSETIESWCWANLYDYEQYIQKLDDEGINRVYGRYLDKQAYLEFIDLMKRYYERSNGL